MHMHSSLQYFPAVPLTPLQLLVPETPHKLLQTVDFPVEHTFFSVFPASCLMNKDQFFPTGILFILSRRYISDWLAVSCILRMLSLVLNSDYWKILGLISSEEQIYIPFTLSIHIFNPELNIFPGFHFALMQVKAGLATIIRNFELRSGRRTPNPFVPDPHSFLLAAKGGLWLDIVKRTDK